MLHIPSYTTLYANRPASTSTRRGGGTALIVSEALALRPLPAAQADAAERKLRSDVVWAVATVEGHETLFGAVYRPPPSSVVIDRDEDHDEDLQLWRHIQTISANYSTVIIGGDFNCNLLASDRRSTFYAEKASELGLKQTVRSPTCFKSQTNPSLLVCAIVGRFRGVCAGRYDTQRSSSANRRSIAIVEIGHSGMEQADTADHSVRITLV